MATKIRYWLIACAGAMLTVLAYVGLKGWELERISRDFTSSATAYEVVFQERLNAYLIELDSVARFRASHAFSEQEFSRFVAPILEVYPELHEVHWVVRRSHEQRLQLEADESIFELSAAGTMMPAQMRAHYFPILFSVSDAQASDVRGLDLGAMPEWQVGLNVDLGKRGAHFIPAGIELLPDGQQLSYLVLPVYQYGMPNVEGYVVASFDIGKSFEYAIARLRDGGIHVDVFDINEQQPARLIYSHQARDMVWSHMPAKLEKDFTISSHIQLADHELELHFEPVKQYFDQHTGSQPWLVVVFGCVITIWMLIYMYRSQRYTENVESLVEARTAQLAESNARQKAIVDHAVDGIITIDKHGTVASFNPAAEAIFLYTAEEVVGQNVKMLMNDHDAEAHDGYLQNYLETGHAKVVNIGREVVGKRKDGSLFPVDLAVSEITLDESRLFVGIVRDITERKRVEKIKNEFISTVSHELRTPLTSIRGSLGLILGGAAGEVPDQLKAMLTIASNNTERLLLLINDILDVQKIESGKLEFHYRVFEVCEFIQKLVADNQGYAHQHNVELLVSHMPEAGTVYGDEDRLTQVVNNLISNAIKFSQAGGQVELAIAYHDSLVRISVKDYGVGIPAAFHNKVFERFTQHDSSDTRKTGGTGLGLSISKSIMERHGGRLDFVSREGVGSMFYIDLPVQRLNASAAVSVRHSSFAPSHDACILIVENDGDVGVVLQRMLTEHGFNCDVATSAEEARELLARGQYQMITLDIMLPDEDGLSLLRELREGEKYRETPVIVISAEADEARCSLNGNVVGIIDWLIKPVDMARLELALAHAASNHAKPNILLVEDEQDVADVVIGMVGEKAYIKHEASLVAARTALANEVFDLVILDVGLPDGSGLDLLDDIHAADAVPRVVVFSAQDVDVRFAQQVDAVLAKGSTSNQELLNKILSYFPFAKFNHDD